MRDLANRVHFDGTTKRSSRPTVIEQVASDAYDAGTRAIYIAPQTRSPTARSCHSRASLSQGGCYRRSYRRLRFNPPWDWVFLASAAVGALFCYLDLVEIDKQTAAWWLIHSAIRSVLRQDDRLASHVVFEQDRADQVRDLASVRSFQVQELRACGREFGPRVRSKAR